MVIEFSIVVILDFPTADIGAWTKRLSMCDDATGQLFSGLSQYFLI